MMTYLYSISILCCVALNAQGFAGVSADAAATRAQQQIAEGFDRLKRVLLPPAHRAEARHSWREQVTCRLAADCHPQQPRIAEIRFSTIPAFHSSFALYHSARSIRAPAASSPEAA